jgi:hypothetical protein
MTPVATARIGVPEGAEKSSPVWQFAHRYEHWPKLSFSRNEPAGRGSCQRLAAIWFACFSALAASDARAALRWRACEAAASFSSALAASCSAARWESRLTAR